MVFICFNVLVITLSVSFFITQFNNEITQNSTILFYELKTLTSIYDTALTESDPLFSRLIPGLAYVFVVLSSVISIAVSIYTTSRYFRRHPNYIMSLTGLVMAISALLSPRYIVPRLLDTQLVGIFVICALIFDIMSITWIYGAKNIYTDLEFSIGRPILKTWVCMWCIAPILLCGLLAWWCSIVPSSIDLILIKVPRWTPIILCLVIILVVAFFEVYKQVDYNCCSMIQEAAQSAKDWGPGDPIVRHAWKQWRSVCEDTGQKDFTLRRRGTRDYTHSIKKGQYSRAKYNGGHVGKTSTAGSSSPNYSGSIFEDSAIEEDVSVDKYNTGFQPTANGSANSSNLPRQFRYSNGSRNTTVSGGSYSTRIHSDKPAKQYFYVQSIEGATTLPHIHSDVNNVSKVEILSAPNEMRRSYIKPVPKNPMGRPPLMDTKPNYQPSSIVIDASSSNNNSSNNKYGSINRQAYRNDHPSGVHYEGGAVGTAAGDICWRKFSVNSAEFSTEL